MRFIIDIVRGIIIGIANIIPGVSGGTMMVSMGIYDTVIYCVTHIFKQFVKSIKILIPYLLGMLIGIGGLSIILTMLFEKYPLPTNTAFIGLVLGGLPVIIKKFDRKKINILGVSLIILFFAIIVALMFVDPNRTTSGTSSQNGFRVSIIMLLLGAIASATMVIPGVSGSMIMMLLGYYETLLASVSNFVHALSSGMWAVASGELAVLIPFGIGVLLGIFGVAKLIEWLLKNFFTYTYCAILGLVVASPVVILYKTNMSAVTVPIILMSLLTFAIGYLISYALSKEKKIEIKE